MIEKWFETLPIIAGVLTGLFFYFSSRIGWRALKDFRMRMKRLQIVNRYQFSTKSASKKLSKQLGMARIVVGAYGDKLVRDKYKSKLERLLVSSGDWENRKYTKLIQRKVIFSVSGFLFTFFLLLLRNVELIPILFAIVLFSYFLPNLERFFQKLTGRKYRRKLKNLLDQSGSWQENDYFVLIRRKLLFGLNSFIFSYLYLVAKDRSFGSLVFSMAAIFLGFFLPDILLQNKVLKRKEELANTLPDAIDMLQMCVNAGLAFPAALSKVAETQNGPVSEEFARVTAEVQLGQARSEALAAMAERTQEENVQRFVSAMMQVDRFGIPVGNVLLEQSKEMRSSRRERARERGQKVPVKILAPIMLCFLPTVLIIILGPAVISIMNAFGS